MIHATRFILSLAIEGHGRDVMTNYMRWCGVVAVAGVLSVPGVAAGVPAFARQTGASCSACHFQHFPGLTPFGRSFKSGGYVQTGG